MKWYKNGKASALIMVALIVIASFSSCLGSEDKDKSADPAIVGTIVEDSLSVEAAAEPTSNSPKVPIEFTNALIKATSFLQMMRKQK